LVGQAVADGSSEAEKKSTEQEEKKRCGKSAAKENEKAASL